MHTCTSLHSRWTLTTSFFTLSKTHSCNSVSACVCYLHRSWWQPLVKWVIARGEGEEERNKTRVWETLYPPPQRERLTAEYGSGLYHLTAEGWRRQDQIICLWESGEEEWVCMQKRKMWNHCFKCCREGRGESVEAAWNEILFKGTFHLTCTLKFKMYFHLLCTFCCNSRQVSLSVWLVEMSHHLVDESKVVEG